VNKALKGGSDKIPSIDKCAAHSRAAFLRTITRPRTNAASRRTPSRDSTQSGISLREESSFSDNRRYRGAHQVPAESDNQAMTVSAVDWPTDTRSRPQSSLASNRTFSIRERLRASYGSSFASDISSLLKHRFSGSYYTNSSRPSIRASSVFDYDDSSAITGIDAFLDQHKSKMEAHNNALLASLWEECCLNRDCIHRKLSNWISEAQEYHTERLYSLVAESQKQWKHRARNPENTTIFFAARHAAPPEIMIAIASNAPDLNSVSLDGQNFLFVLDPRNLNKFQCICSTYSKHGSGFECLMLALEERHPFDFERMDNYGRSFLSYLCSSPAFDIQWLSDIMEKHRHWYDIVVRISKQRDCTGYFLIDFLAHNPTYQAVDPGTFFLDCFTPFICGASIIDALRPPWTSRLNLHATAEILQKYLGEDRHGRTPMYEFLRGEGNIIHTGDLHYARRIASELDRYITDVSIYGVYVAGSTLVTYCQRAALGRYDKHGHTPAMHFLQAAVAHEMNETLIQQKLKVLVKHGLNVNACSRHGSTMLHFAIQHSLPSLVAYLLEQGAQLEHCDEKSLNALHYAREAVNRSMRTKHSAQLFGRSIKTVGQLLISKANHQKYLASQQSANSVQDVLLEHQNKRSLDFKCRDADVPPL
jgi:23S rRNA maturation mini-RNase III